MVRHMAVAMTLACAMTAGLHGAERATVVLTDGTRQSGELVFHGSGNRNIIDNFLNLGQNGSEKTIPLDQVALIDIGGEQPAAADFQQLPGSPGQHLLVMRGGGMQRGRLVNVINGDTVQWENEAGQTQQYAVRDVMRIYTNSDAARRLYPQLAAAAAASSSAAPAATATSGVADAPVPAGAIRIPANQPWVPAGVLVRRGQRVVFGVTGQVQFSTQASHVAGPDGNPGVQTPNLPLAGAPVGALIGRIGSSAPFLIGSNRQPVLMPESGPLLLGVNDTDVTDNAGAFVVQLQQVR